MEAEAPARAPFPSLRVTGMLALVLLATWFLAPLAPEPETLDTFRLAVYGSTAVFAALLTALLAHVVPRVLPVRGRWLAIVGVIAFALVIGLNLAEVPIASDVAKLVVAMTLGVGLLRPLDRPWWLLPIAVVVPLADAWSVYSSRGVTHAVVEQAATNRAFLDWPTIATPVAGYDYLDFGRIGIVDILFMTLFLTAAVRWDLGVRRLLVALPLALVATTVIAYEGTDAVPALPMLCIAFLACTLPALVRDLRAELRSRDGGPAQ